ncbi:MAG: anthranilate phosphoribosyltransferase [Deltaproteobacteria bacterium]|nr:anthranilate phosphoribosyltransferase [Deltaproteobacteria bacterium]
MDITTALQQMLAGGSLGRSETESLFGSLMDGDLNEAHKAALLIVLRMKGETADEIAGAATAMRQRVLAIPHSRDQVVDTCGTGGDGKGTFNISTAAAFVAAAAGVPIAKHGNRSVSSLCGSADVLSRLGLDVEVTPEEAGRALDALGIAFLFAPKLHPAMREVMPVRKQLGLRTVFNILGPLTNPAGARRQVMGVYAPELVDLVAQVLARLGSEHALVVHGDGLDEITTTGETLVSEVRAGEVRRYTVEPTALGVQVAPQEALAGGDPQTNAQLLSGVLAGEVGPLADVTVLNAGAAIYVAGLVGSLQEGVDAARQVQRSGAAAAKLSELVQFHSGRST